ncbi:MAG TPA: GAF domain-containing protein [Fimbriimonadaceae bacterium]|nr:GAF domain-containing protein [Fimbriimonadaceae bacterium]
MIPHPEAERLVARLAASRSKGLALRAEAMELLAGLPNYDWSGVYRLEGDTLVLDAYVGEETDHTRIPVGRGVCGTAVADDRNQVIADVRELTNYLSCSTKTRSEVVVLIRREEKVLGQIDIDGHQVGAFDSSDEELLERVAGLLAANWE